MIARPTHLLMPVLSTLGMLLHEALPLQETAQALLGQREYSLDSF
jgi:hypothetical protein